MERLQETVGDRNANWNHHDDHGPATCKPSGNRCFNVNLNVDPENSKLLAKGNGNSNRSFPLTVREMPGHHIYEKICSVGNLRLAFRKARKGKSDKDYVKSFELNLNSEILLALS